MTVMEPVVYVIDEEVTATDAICRVANLMNLSCRILTSGQQFLNDFDRSQHGCLVTELKISDVNGLQVLQRLREGGVLLPVIFVTAHATVPIAVRAMRAGAFHFLEKPCHEQELWDTIEAAIVADGERRRAAQERAAVQERLALLTWKEEEVLRMIGEGKSNRVIAEEMDLSVRTVEIRRNAMLKKLGFQTADELIRFAVSLGSGGLADGRQAPKALVSGERPVRFVHR